MILFLAAAIAMLLSNSPIAEQYFSIINQQNPVNVLFIVNDVLMTIFFLDVGLQIKHQIIVGHLSKIKQVILPAIAACGGVILPALIYAFINRHDPIALQGWAIPTATDIAFALGIIILLGKRIPVQLKIILLAIAIFDDMIAIIIIATFYTPNISTFYLILSASAFFILCLMNYCKVQSIIHYLMVGALLWYFMLNTGIHPTISGVMVALAVPLSTHENIHRPLYLWVAFVIMPIFGLTNAGISLQGLQLHDILTPVPLGIAIGLFIGKQLGIFSISWLAVKLKIAEIPKSLSWLQYYGMAIVCGIGFTMSIFIGDLAFKYASNEYAILNKAGVLIGSIISALLGYLFLHAANSRIFAKLK